MDMRRSLGLNPDGTPLVTDRKQIIRYLTLKLAALGYGDLAAEDEEMMPLARDLVAKVLEQNRLLADYLCPADRRIQDFLDRHLADVTTLSRIRLPAHTLVLDRHGLARELSLPLLGHEAHSRILSSYRLPNGVLHNPTNDRRTTKGVFHIAEGGLPIPADKLAVPRRAFAALLAAALAPPTQDMQLPFTSRAERPLATFVSLLLRPVVCPEVPGFAPEKSMEIRFFAPGALVANLDFIESIFGNAGDPMLPEHDAALDVEHWTGHTGCVILAPHLTGLKKRDLGLPPASEATPRQKRDGMCFSDPDELYNDGKPFKVTCRTSDGVMVTLLADNYFGYCKKEVKTQISFAANLYGLAEEEHAGGALAFPTYNLGETFRGDAQESTAAGYSFKNLPALLGDNIDVRSQGYAVDRNDPDILYVPEDTQIELWSQRVTWQRDGSEEQLQLLPGKVYVLPNGYKIRMVKHQKAPSWMLIGTVAEGTFCHKPFTVSGGGKSEISKSILDAVLSGPFYVGNFVKDLDMIEGIIKRDYSDRVRPERLDAYSHERLTRPLLHPARSLGSVIKMLTPSPTEFTDAYNAWLLSIPHEIKALVFVIKRMYKPEWGDEWRRYFSVDVVNGSPGHELKYKNRQLVGSYLRVGLMDDGSWRTFKLRQDFRPAEKVQLEDDITASVVVPASVLPGLGAGDEGTSVKLASNCEYRLFQRPDDAVHRGYDQQTERDMSGRDLFCSNYQPLTPADAKTIVNNAIAFAEYTAPMQEHLRRAAAQAGGYVVSSAQPRLVGGKPSQNPRYLQLRPDVANPRDRYLAEISTRLKRRIPRDKPVVFTVNAVLPGRRNNRADKAAGVRPLAVYNPIHYQELPELFMDFIASLTGKSPSTTGAGSEGALTKGPFNALRPAADLNNALVAFILTGHAGFSTAAGWVGPSFRVDHDISLLMPEIWSRLTPSERDPAFLISEGMLEKLDDFEHEGRIVRASRLGYRITSKFVHTYFGRVFDNPAAVFTPEILRPELQDRAAFADGIENIIEAQMRVARGYFEDGSIDEACPPLKALLNVMAYDKYDGMDARSPKLRSLFTREALLESDWYQERLLVKQQRDIDLWQRHVAYLKAFIAKKSHAGETARLRIPERLKQAERTLRQVSSLAYLKSLSGTIGADPLGHGSAIGAGAV